MPVVTSAPALLRLIRAQVFSTPYLLAVST